MEYVAMNHSVFLSYSSDDKTIANAVCAGLESHQIRCWIAPRDVGPGQDWAATIVDAIEQCEIFVVILSTGSNKSSQVLREVERAVNAGKIVIPFRIEDLVPSKSLGYFLSVSHWLDAMTGPMEEHIDELSTNIKRLIEGKGEEDIPQDVPTGIDGPSLLSRAGAQLQDTAKTQNKLYLIIIALLVIVVSGGVWFVFVERNHQQPVQQQMNGGMMESWNDNGNWR